MANLHYETVTPLLKDILQQLMNEPLFDSFVLVGGTALSLRLGHRMSVDIDLFTNAEYGSLDFSLFEDYFRNNFTYYDRPDKSGIVGMGRSYYIGNSSADNIKVDLFYRDEIIDKPDTIDGIRLASLEDVIGMKVDVVNRGGRKKDFWDLHALLDQYLIPEMLDMHQTRYEWSHEREELISKFTDFTIADNDPDPRCLKDKDWELIKLDFVELMEGTIHDFV